VALSPEFAKKPALNTCVALAEISQFRLFRHVINTQRVFDTRKRLIA
jgi:hypothetical protein